MSNKPTGSQPRLRSFVVILACLLALAAGATARLAALAQRASKTAASDKDKGGVQYTFDRPVKEGEHTYAWYRKTHADEAAKRYGVDPKAVGDGMDTWHWWTGVDNQKAWRKAAILTGSKAYGALNARTDWLKMLQTQRADRWTVMGLINDPDTVAATKPDKYGLMLDRMKDGSLTWDPEVFGYSSGVIGFQLFTNKDFDAKKWSVQKYLGDPGSVEPPYLVGMACSLCHVAFNPDRPPSDPANPKWDNLASNIGNQYFREGMMVGGQGMPKNNFLYQYLYHQQPGTSETSRYPTDFINGPILINSIYRLGERLKLAREEKITPAQRDLIKSMYANAGLKLDDPTGALGGTEAEPTMKVIHVLADGADSMGLLMASTRVYVNEYMSFPLWVSATWALNPWDLEGSARRGFKGGEFPLMGEARKDANTDWMITEKRMPNMALMLTTWDSFPLADAKEIAREGKPKKDGKAYLSTDAAVLTRGKLVFADNCARCHSSKSPSPMPGDPEAQKAAWRQLVQRDDFLKDNYMSDDQRYPVSELGTNAQRSLGTNANAGETWGQMSSQTFKDLKAPMEPLEDHDADGKPIPLYNPLTGKHDLKFTGHRTFYRTPTLVSIWATAPYLHNNSVGIYRTDPSIAGRMADYEDGMTKLLWPEKRLGVQSIKATDTETSIPDLFPMLKPLLPEFADLPLQFDLLRIPKGTPIDLIMNVHAKDVKAVLQAYVDGVLQGQPHSRFAELRTKNHDAAMKLMTEKLLEVNQCPDFIEDRGHIYGHQLSDQDKRALIEYIKYF